MAVLPAEGARTLATSWRPDVLAQRPWSVVTHMFTHQGVWHLGMNMLLLFWMGRVYHGEVGSRRLLSTYLGGGLAGFLAYFLVTNGFKPLQNSTYRPWSFGVCDGHFWRHCHPQTQFEIQPLVVWSGLVEAPLSGGMLCWIISG